jgi:hypothetical protein
VSRRVSIALAAAALAAGCAAAGGRAGPAPTRATDFAPSQIRQPVVLVRLAVRGSDLRERERAALPDEYEGALLEGLNRRAVITRDVRVLGPDAAAPDERQALARARELAADHAIVVDVRVESDVVTVCEETKRPLRGRATVWRQEAAVLRASDGALRLRLAGGPALTAIDVEIDCDVPRGARRRPSGETATDAVERLLGRLFGG